MTFNAQESDKFCNGIEAELNKWNKYSFYTKMDDFVCSGLFYRGNV